MPTDMIVVADDFTGAAEIAAAGFLNGFRSEVARPGCPLPVLNDAETDATLLVFDSDSRLCPPHDSRRAVARLGHVLASTRPTQLLYKKTDSILRGNVAAEIESMLAFTGRKRALLLPANPSTGRVLVDRVYRVDGVPLSETEFAHDPHHPAKSSDPLELLGATERTPIRYCRLTDPMPVDGIVVCEAASIQDVSAWARRIGPNDIPAGGRDFFTAAIQSRIRETGAPHARSVELPNRVLVIQGTLSPQALVLRSALQEEQRTILEIAPSDLLASTDSVSNRLDSLQAEIAAAIDAGLIPVLSARRQVPVAPDLPSRIQTAFARIARQLRSRGQVEHFLIEGGATASSVLQALDLQRLSVREIWAPGVVTLASCDTGSDCLFTTKPGSYAWPENLVNALRNARNAHTFPSDI